MLEFVCTSNYLPSGFKYVSMASVYNIFDYANDHLPVHQFLFISQSTYFRFVPGKVFQAKRQEARNQAVVCNPVEFTEWASCLLNVEFTEWTSCFRILRVLLAFLNLVSF